MLVRNFVSAFVLFVFALISQDCAAQQNNWTHQFV